MIVVQNMRRFMHRNRRINCTGVMAVDSVRDGVSASVRVAVQVWLLRHDDHGRDFLSETDRKCEVVDNLFGDGGGVAAIAKGEGRVGAVGIGDVPDSDVFGAAAGSWRMRGVAGV